MRRTVDLIRIASFLALFAMLLAACGGGSTQAPTGGTTPTKPAMTVALVTDIGGLNDNGFNHLAYTGYTKAQNQYGFPQKIIPTQSQNDYLQKLTLAASSARTGTHAG